MLLDNVGDDLTVIYCLSESIPAPIIQGVIFSFLARLAPFRRPKETKIGGRCSEKTEGEMFGGIVINPP